MMKYASVMMMMVAALGGIAQGATLVAGWAADDAVVDAADGANTVVTVPDSSGNGYTLTAGMTFQTAAPEGPRIPTNCPHKVLNDVGGHASMQFSGVETLGQPFDYLTYPNVRDGDAANPKFTTDIRGDSTYFMVLNEEHLYGVDTTSEFSLMLPYVDTTTAAGNQSGNINFSSQWGIWPPVTGVLYRTMYFKVPGDTRYDPFQSIIAESTTTGTSQSVPLGTWSGWKVLAGVWDDPNVVTQQGDLDMYSDFTKGIAANPWVYDRESGDLLVLQRYKSGQ
jgi:hypothetical protein